MNVLYQRLNLDNIQEINNHKLELSVLQMITIGLTSFSVLMTIVFSLLYLKENRKKKSDAIESLMSGEIAQTTLDDWILFYYVLCMAITLSWIVDLK